MEHPHPNFLRSLSALAIVFCISPLNAIAQQADTPEFEIENAVLDTSILFAIGAQEAVQELRGAFGWPTFQEGLVEGIFFRFDPDGYARFAPTDRLDTDVFEVICRSRTVTCMAHKGIFSLNPIASGQLQIVIADLAEGEEFFLLEGTSEIQLPNEILQPMDTRTEGLLSSNGEMIIRRGDVERARVSLVGFRQTLAYLRWVAARQDYMILPRDWPVPAGGTLPSVPLTAPLVWSNPLVQQTAAVRPVAVTPAIELAEGADVEALRREVEILQSLIAQRAVAGQRIEPPMGLPIVEQIAAPILPAATTVQADAARIAALENTVAILSAGLVSESSCGAGSSRLCSPGTIALHDGLDTAPLSLAPGVSVTVDPAVEATEELIIGTSSADPLANTLPGSSPVVPAALEQSNRMAQINYLMTVIGLDAETAFMVLKLADFELDKLGGDSTACDNTSTDLAFADKLTREALANLVDPQLMLEAAPPSADLQAGIADITGEYVFLSEYLQAIFDPVGGK